MAGAQMRLSGGIRVAASIAALKDFDLAGGTVALSRNWGFTVDSAAPARTSDLLWQQEGSIEAAGAVTIDLAGSEAHDPKDYWGADARFDRVHAVLVRNTTAGAGGDACILSLGGGSDGGGQGAFEWFFGAGAESIRLAPGGFLAAVHGRDPGWPVYDSSADIMRLSNLDENAPLTFQVIIIGQSEGSAAATTTPPPE